MGGGDSKIRSLNAQRQPSRITSSAPNSRSDVEVRQLLFSGEQFPTLSDLLLKVTTISDDSTAPTSPSATPTTDKTKQASSPDTKGPHVPPSKPQGSTTNTETDSSSTIKSSFVQELTESVLEMRRLAKAALKQQMSKTGLDRLRFTMVHETDEELRKLLTKDDEAHRALNQNDSEEEEKMEGSSLAYAITHKVSVQKFRTLIEFGADVERASKFEDNLGGLKPLAHAVAASSWVGAPLIGYVVALILAGASVHCKGRIDGKSVDLVQLTVLTAPNLYDDATILRYLHKLSKKNGFRWPMCQYDASLLAHATLNGQPSVVRQLLKMNARLDVLFTDPADNISLSALGYAAHGDFAQSASVLAMAGAKIDQNVACGEGMKSFVPATSLCNWKTELAMTQGAAYFSMITEGKDKSIRISTTATPVVVTLLKPQQNDSITASVASIQEQPRSDSRNETPPFVSTTTRCGGHTEWVLHNPNPVTPVVTAGRPEVAFGPIEVVSFPETILPSSDEGSISAIKEN